MARTVDLERRREIAARAFEVVKERGVARTTMSDVARALEMKRTALYHYFPNLSAICRVVLEQLLDRIRLFCIERMGQHRHPLDQLDALIVAGSDFHAGRREDIKAMVQLWAISDPAERDALSAMERDAQAPTRVFLIALVANGIERGSIKPCDPEGLVDLVLTLTEGLQLVQVTTTPNLEPVLAFFRQHVLAPLRVPTAAPAVS
jgi:AcrR family transcriptional regulator